MRLRLFASCAPGLESLLETEVRGLIPAGSDVLQPAEIQTAAGGVHFQGTIETLGHALVGLGLAARVLVRLDKFPVRHLNQLEARIADLNWSTWLWSTRPFRVRSTSKKSKLYHTGAIDQRVRKGVDRALGREPSVKERATIPSTAGLESEKSSGAEWPEVVVRLERDQCLVSLDVSGTPLHRRGYRRNPHRAPLREDLARALVMVSGWRGQTPLWDPFCGSGTVLVEAAIWAGGYPPGLLRDFALTQTRLADEAWLRELKRQRWAWREHFPGSIEPQAVEYPLSLWGADVDPKAIAAAQQNFAAWPWAGGDGGGADGRNQPPATSAVRACPAIEWTVADMRKLPGPTTAVAIVTNPPWGGRVGGGRDLLPLYQKLGGWRRQAGPLAKLAMVAGNRELAYRTGVPLHSAFLTDAGGLKINALIEGQPGEPKPKPATV